MKHIIPLVLAALCLLIGGRAFAQLDVRLEPVRKEFLLGESVALKLTFTNHTDRTIALSNTPGRSWLTFTVTQSGSQIPLRPVAVPNFPKMTIGPGSRQSYQVNLRPYYRFNTANSYKVIASVRMPDMQTTYSSNRAGFTLSFGGNVSSFRVQAGGRNLQMCVKLMRVDNKDYLFGQVLNDDTRTALGACAVGPYLNFMKPRVVLDRAQNLHILCQSTPTLFSYAVMGTDGQRKVHQVLTRTGGPVDLVSTGNGIRALGLTKYVAPKPDAENTHSASDRPR